MLNIHSLIWMTCFIVANEYDRISASSYYKADWISIDSRPLPKWFNDNKIGISINWGLFSVPAIASEWMWWFWQGENPNPAVVSYMNQFYRPDWTYTDFASNFHAELYNPDQWADLFQASGAKYVIFTSKHHDGFAMWPSKYSFNWNSLDIGPKRDLLGELVESLRNKTDLMLGIYYSLFEWFHPFYLEDKKNHFQTQVYPRMKVLPELKELVLRYKPDIIWSDGDWEAPDTYWDATNFLAWLYNESPIKDRVVVNDRWGSNVRCNFGGFITCTDKSDFNEFQPKKREIVLNIDKKSPAFRRTSLLEDYLTIEQIIHQIIIAASDGNNVLVNIGVASDGTIPTIYEERLRQMGSWLQMNGEAIYDTIPWFYKNDSSNSNVWYTASTDGRYIYACLLVWPQKSAELILDSIVPKSNTIISLLGSTYDYIPWSEVSPSYGIIIHLSQLNFNWLKTDWAWVFKIENFYPNLNRNRG